MKFGLVGTGYWAEVTHGAGLAAQPGVDLVAVWGRSPARTAELADRLGVAAAATFDELLERVDAVAFAVPPQVQAPLATRAAEAGKHLLLEKPIATDLADADRLVTAVDTSGVASVVFFTARFETARRAWLAGMEGDAWDGAWARWFAANFAEGSPYAGSTWRWERGGLWDLGPHLLSLLVPVLGPVEGVTAESGAGDLVHLVLGHRGGATSTASMTLRAPRGAASVEVSFWGPNGVSSLPQPAASQAEALSEAARELVDAARQGRVDHPCGVHFGREVVRVLAQAEAQLPAGFPDTGAAGPA